MTMDTTIHVVADEMPRFPSPCEQLDTAAQFKMECSQQFLLRYISGRSLYPKEAREQGLQGVPVISFIVEPNGLINRPEIVRDPGGNLGLAALQAVLVMQQEVRWRPAIIDGKPVRFKFNLPIRFRLEEPKPYFIAGLDTVYTDLTVPLDYEGGAASLQKYFDDNLNYPPKWEDSCRVGQIDVQLLVQPDNIVRILDMTDYSDLGLDFWYEAIHTATSTYGNWIPAEYQGRKVPAAFDISLNFLPTNSACTATISNYQRALALANEATPLVEDPEQLSAGIAKLDEALRLFPNDGQLLILRGQALLDANRLSEACTDLTKARRIALVSWFDSVLPLICR